MVQGQGIDIGIEGSGYGRCQHFRRRYKRKQGSWGEREREQWICTCAFSFRNLQLYVFIVELMNDVSAATTTRAWLLALVSSRYHFGHDTPDAGDYDSLHP